MAIEISYVLMTPYTVMKSRTGGIIARLLSRTDLELVGARIISFANELCFQYAELLKKTIGGRDPQSAQLMAEYVLENLPPQDGKFERGVFLLFRGENACAKLCSVVGSLSPQKNKKAVVGETIRDTYADYVLDKTDGTVKYFEPAVFTPPSADEALLKMFADYMAKTGNIAENVVGSTPEDERTLVIIKPDNWRHPSTKPGAIIDMISRTGLRIVGCKLYQMSVAEALEFYGPVKDALRRKLAPIIGGKAKDLLEMEFRIPLASAAAEKLTEIVGCNYADDQFSQIIEFMSGRRPENCPPEELDAKGRVKCLVLIYEGPNAIAKIRDVLGPTDPTKAPGGTVRRDFGSNVMVNTAHASDAPESVVREMKVVKIDKNDISEVIYDYLKQ